MIICEECKGSKRSVSNGRWVACGSCERRESGITEEPVKADDPAPAPDPYAVALAAQLADAVGTLGGIATVLNAWGREAYGVAEEDVSKLAKFAENLWAMTTRAIESAKARVDSSDQALAVATAPQIAVPETNVVEVPNVPGVLKETANGKKR